MGVGFALGFLLVLMVIIGGIGVAVGTVILIVRYINKKTTKKKYTASKVIGITILLFGGLLAVTPLVLGVVTGVGFINTLSEQSDRKIYFSQYEETPIIISVQPKSIHDKIYFMDDTFILENKTYMKVDGISVGLNDKNRGAAVANLNDGSVNLTVYKYNFPDDCDLVCAGSDIFATEDSLSTLIDYFNNKTEFTYQYRYIANSSTKFADFEMDDEIFLGLINYDSSFVTSASTFGNYKVEYNIIQSSCDNGLKRQLVVHIDENDNVKVRRITNPLSLSDYSVESNDYGFLISDEKTKEKFLAIGELVISERHK